MPEESGPLDRVKVIIRRAGWLQYALALITLGVNGFIVDQINQAKAFVDTFLHTAPLTLVFALMAVFAWEATVNERSVEPVWALFLVVLVVSGAMTAGNALGYTYPQPFECFFGGSIFGVILGLICVLLGFLISYGIVDLLSSLAFGIFLAWAWVRLQGNAPDNSAGVT